MNGNHAVAGPDVSVIQIANAHVVGLTVWTNPENGHVRIVFNWGTPAGADEVVRRSPVFVLFGHEVVVVQAAQGFGLASVDHVPDFAILIVAGVQELDDQHIPYRIRQDIPILIEFVDDDEHNDEDEGEGGEEDGPVVWGIDIEVCLFQVNGVAPNPDDQHH